MTTTTTETKMNFSIPTYKAGETIPDDVTYAYILDATGWVLYKKNDLFTAISRIKKNESLPELKEGFTIYNKLPIELFQKIENFFKQVYKAHKSEAVALLLYENGIWDTYIPEQVVSSGAAKYDNLPDGLRLAGSIHSHGNMTAFHSGTDDHDELNFDGIHITIGKIEYGYPEYAVSLVASGQRFGQLKLADVVEVATNDIEVPKTWMDRVKEPVKEIKSMITRGLWGGDYTGYQGFQDASMDKRIYKGGKKTFNDSKQIKRGKAYLPNYSDI